jgi:hypothetical protein
MKRPGPIPVPPEDPIESNEHSNLSEKEIIMSIEIIPPGSSAVVTDKHHNNNDRHDKDVELMTAIKDAEAQLSRDVKDTRHDSVVATTNGKYESVLATTTAGSAGVLATKEARFDVMQGLCNLTALNYQIEGRALLEAAKNAAALNVQAEKIAAEAARQAAECCCELKEKITAEGQKTRDLINANQAQDLRDRAARAENALTAYYTCQRPPVTP